VRRWDRRRLSNRAAYLRNCVSCPEFCIHTPKPPGRCRSRLLCSDELDRPRDGPAACNSGLGARGSGLGARGSGLEARGSRLEARGSGLGARGSGLGARGSRLGARQQTRFELRRDHLPGAPDPDEVVGAPTHCPTCRSQNLTTTSKVVNAESYWRCEACGEVWNVARLRAGSRYAAYRPFGR
jgi:hypothetical protein